MKKKVLEIARPIFSTLQTYPLFVSGIQAGFPSPAEDYIESELDLNDLLITHPAATFFVRVIGDSMQDAGIHSGDTLVVDRSITPSSGKIVVAIIDGEFTVKRFVIKENGSYLIPENPRYSAVRIDQNESFQVWGVVTYVIHKAQ